MKTTVFVENDGDIDRLVKILKELRSRKDIKTFGFEVEIHPITDDSAEFDHLLGDDENADILMG